MARSLLRSNLWLNGNVTRFSVCANDVAVQETNMHGVASGKVPCGVLVTL